jgi:hypothetical protein
MASLRKVDQQPTSDLHRLDAMRLWLVSGVHFVDPRRRFGSHGRARELLVAEQSVSHASERWHALAAALHRHTVRGGLSELRPDERHVITLAYLEGRTNREIAALLGVSVTTVQRRLLFALGRLEAYIGRTGVWLSALVLVAATYAIRPGPRLVRWVATTAGSPDRAQRVATTLTAGAMSAAVLGIVAFTSDSAMPSTPPPVATAPIVTQIHVGAPLVTSIGSQISQPSAVQPTLVVEGTTTATTDRDLEGTSPNPRRHHNNGCHHNPTSAPPPVPVGSATSHPTGAPVTHPGAGGCRANGG